MVILPGIRGFYLFFYGLCFHRLSGFGIKLVVTGFPISSTSMSDPKWIFWMFSLEVTLVIT